MYNKTIIRVGVSDILNNQGLGKYYRSQPLAWLTTLTLILIILGITKRSSNNCLYCNLSELLQVVTHHKWCTDLGHSKCHNVITPPKC